VGEGGGDQNDVVQVPPTLACYPAQNEMKTLKNVVRREGMGRCTTLSIIPTYSIQYLMHVQCQVVTAGGGGSEPKKAVQGLPAWACYPA
jgi:hypothetical protein